MISKTLENIINLRREELRSRYKVFGNFKPLKIGISRDLEADGVVMDMVTKRAIGFHVGSCRYVKNVLSGTVRYDLEGNEAGVVTEDEKKYTLKMRARQKLKKEKVIFGLKKQEEQEKRHAEKLVLKARRLEELKEAEEKKRGEQKSMLTTVVVKKKKKLSFDREEAV